MCMTFTIKFSGKLSILGWDAEVVDQVNECVGHEKSKVWMGEVWGWGMFKNKKKKLY